MRGIITRVSLENFVTYKSVEFRPGRNLNVIIGPNGTGKSTIVCAIVLGLGGKPKVVARGSNIGSYVKEGCQTAKIEIELYNPDGTNYVIGRMIDLNSKSVWSYNGNITTQKAVEKIISDLNIQVDNLCQFLPQDRVQDFAKMDQRSLLENTEKTVGSAEMFEFHTTLKKYRDEQVALEQNITQIKSQAEIEQQQNDRYELQVSNLTEKKLLNDKIHSLRQKYSWKKYFDLQNRLKDAQKDHTLAMQSVSNNEKIKKDLEFKRKLTHDNYNKSESKMKGITNEGSKRLKSLTEKLSEATRIDDRLEELAEQLQRDIAQEEKRNGEVEKLTQMVNKLQNDANEAEKEPEQDIKAEINSLLPKIGLYNDQVNQLRNQAANFICEIKNINHDITSKNLEKKRVEGAVAQRLDGLRRRKPGVYAATMWLKENACQFQGQVFGPMLLEINVIDNQYAKYVENCISTNDLLAFSCQYGKDMTKLLKILREEMKLDGINCVTLNDDNQDYVPQHSIDSIRKYGFHTYVRETFNAPRPIMQYLCRNFQVHDIPIGDNSTFEKSTQVPGNIKKFFSDQNFFQTRVSKYSGLTTCKTQGINPANFLASSVDSGVLQAINDTLAELASKKMKIEADMTHNKDAARVAEGHLDTLRARKRVLQEKLDNKRTVQARLKAKIQQRLQMQQGQRDVLQLKNKCNSECQKLVKKLCALQHDLVQLTKELHASILESSLVKEERDKLRDIWQVAENECVEHNTKMQSARELVETVAAMINRTKQTLKQYKSAAKEITEGLGPNDPEFRKYVTAFDSMPESLEDIDNEIKVNQGKVDCLGSDNDEVIADYEARKEKIAELNNKVAKGEENAASLQVRMDQLKDRWLPPLQNLIDRINANFGLSFNQLGCAGEVSLSTGANSNDFHQYGLCIKVKYRDSEQLQELNQHLQSGGERAVATAIFMISLQELTHVPFRCVDEINQGMDPVNERLIFELLVKTTSQSDTAQYFLLTPKLLPSLLYEKTVNVMCVYNGKYTAKDDWDTKSYCRKRQQRGV